MDLAWLTSASFGDLLYNLSIAHVLQIEQVAAFILTNVFITFLFTPSHFEVVEVLDLHTRNNIHGEFGQV